MPPAVVALMFAAGAGTWVYTKVLRSTGGNTQNALIVAGISGAFAFAIMLIVLGYVDKLLQ